jgi:hypothetical protein
MSIRGIAEICDTRLRRVHWCDLLNREKHLRPMLLERAGGVREAGSLTPGSSAMNTFSSNAGNISMFR